jgi:hypothetical protein
MGWGGVRVAQDDVIWKRPDVYDNDEISRLCDDDEKGDTTNDNVNKDAKSTIGFHQDSSYISYNFVPYNSNSCTLWIALDNSDSTNGGLTYAIGSNSWSTYDIDIRTGARMNRESDVGMTFMSKGTYTSPLHTALHLHNNATGSSITYDDIKLETPHVGSGSALLHLQDTWHGSSGNASKTKERRAIAIHFIKDGSRFRPSVNNNNNNNSATPWGDTNYIYGRYKMFNSDRVEGSFFPCIAGERREEWIDEYVLDAGRVHGFDVSDIGKDWVNSL